jgi:hypothetical protein
MAQRLHFEAGQCSISSLTLHIFRKDANLVF